MKKMMTENIKNSEKMNEDVFEKGLHIEDISLLFLY